jgi:hypothetical protein
MLIKNAELHGFSSLPSRKTTPGLPDSINPEMKKKLFFAGPA